MKYDLVISQEAMQANLNRLTNQLWKLIPMREHDENWISQLDNVILEIVGLQEILEKSEDVKFLTLLTKLEGLRQSEVSFDVYRTTVFKSISLLREVGI